MRKIYFSTALVIIGAMLSAMLTACDTGKPFKRYEGVIWNTSFHITYASNVTLDDSILAVMRDVELSVSPYVAGSLVSRINRGETMQTDPIFRRVFEESRLVCRYSHGAFDPTLGPVIDLWGFGTKGHDCPAPSQEDIDSVMAGVGILDCSIDSTGLLTKKDRMTQFNFSAVAKGYGCDMIAEMLRRNGVVDYMVEIGGEIVVNGRSPHGTKWRIMIDAPVESSDSVVHQGLAVIEIDSCAVATSGNYRNYRVVDGRIVGHTIDPVTGAPAHSEVLSATVVAPRCIMADALATACMVMPLDSAMAMIEEIDGASAMMVTRAPESSDSISLHITSGFPEIRR